MREKINSLINMREKICYRSQIMTLPREISDIVLGQKMNCTETHAFLSQYFGSRKGKTYEKIKEEEEIWARVGKIHFPDEEVFSGDIISTISSDTFADLCSKRNPLLSDALDELLGTIFDCIENIHTFYNDAELDMSAFENFQDLKNTYNFYTDFKGYSPRRFIVDYQDSLYYLCLNVSDFAHEHEDSYGMIQNLEQSGDWKIGKFVEMFKQNSNLFVSSAEPLFDPGEDEPETLKRKIWSQYAVIPEFITDAYDLLRKTEDSIYVSHLYLTGHWIDEVTLSSETLINSVILELEQLDEEFIKLLPMIGMFVMKYVDNNDLKDYEWLSDETRVMEEDELSFLKRHFREGTVTSNMDGIETPTPYFTTKYLSGFSAQEWADILVGEISADWCLDELTTGDNGTEFTLSIRYKNLEDWKNSYLKTIP